MSGLGSGEGAVSDVLAQAARSTWLKDGRDAPTLVLPDIDLPDLATSIHRQRLVVEGEPIAPIDDAMIRGYLSELTRVCDMDLLMEPVTHRSDRYGWAGWVHWETSGAHFYAWEDPLLFFSVDIYTCKPFDPGVVVDFTAEYLNSRRVVAKGF
jgi:S-adenosylmethionine decarboxylase